jgi:hypothetical protein
MRVKHEVADHLRRRACKAWLGATMPYWKMIERDHLVAQGMLMTRGCCLWTACMCMRAGSHIERSARMLAHADLAILQNRPTLSCKFALC